MRRIRFNTVGTKVGTVAGALQTLWKPPSTITKLGKSSNYIAHVLDNGNRPADGVVTSLTLELP